MRMSNFFEKTQKETPKEADNISSEFLLRGQFIDKLGAGIYTILPLGWRVMRKIMRIIEEEMNEIGGREIFMPTLQPKELWLKTDRWDHIDPPLFKFKDRHNRELCLGPTHEEVIVDIVRRRNLSYADIPFMLYQIQNKFRNEMRSTGGLLRVREFIMKDAYSFHTDKKDLDGYYLKVIESYKKTFNRFGLEVVTTKADSGTIGGSESHEFILLAETGEDKVAVCEGKDCGFAANIETLKDIKIGRCPDCGVSVKTINGIENGHCFKLGTVYSEKMGAMFTDKNGAKKPIWMGCYGIGVGRLMATIVEVHHDDRGIIWPKEVSPYDVHLISLVGHEADAVYHGLEKSGLSVIYDDREVSAGVKLADADLTGIPWRIVVSAKTIEENGVELKNRASKEGKIMTTEEVIKKIRSK